MLKKMNLKEIKELRLEILTRMTDLAIAGFGLVAALAWNDSIRALFDRFLPKTADSGAISQLFYAVIITIIVVLVTLKLGRMTSKAKDELKEFKVEKDIDSNNLSKFS
ncbi:MAG: DUF5654 family protein [Patescibacteria group bacterium]